MHENDKKVYGCRFYGFGFDSKPTKSSSNREIVRGQLRKRAEQPALNYTIFRVISIHEQFA